MVTLTHDNSRFTQQPERRMPSFSKFLAVSSLLAIVGCAGNYDASFPLNSPDSKPNSDSTTKPDASSADSSPDTKPIDTESPFDAMEDQGTDALVTDAQDATSTVDADAAGDLADVAQDSDTAELPILVTPDVLDVTEVSPDVALDVPKPIDSSDVGDIVIDAGDGVSDLSDAVTQTDVPIMDVPEVGDVWTEGIVDVAPDETGVPLFLQDWAFKLPVAVKFVELAESVTDEVGFARIDSATLIANGKVKADCSDFRVADSTLKLLPYSIEACGSIDTIVWFGIPNLDKGSKAFGAWLYYGNPNAVAADDPKTVWKNYVDTWTFNYDNAQDVWPSSSGLHDLKTTNGSVLAKSDGSCKYGGCANKNDGSAGAMVTSGDFIWPEMSVSGWVRFDPWNNVTNALETIVCFGDGAFSPSWNYPWYLGKEGKAGGNFLTMITSNLIYPTSSKGVKAFEYNAWTHVAFTFQGNSLQLYLNGVLIGTSANVSILPVLNSSLRFGANYPGNLTANSLHGDIDQFTLSSTVRSTSSISMEASLSSSNSSEELNK